MNSVKLQIAFYIIIPIFFFHCNQKEDKVHQLFTKLDSDESGLVFNNNVNNTDELNIFGYRHLFNGGGVALGDINNDGLLDVYLISNFNSNKLFLNQGNLKFKDITQQSNTAGNTACATGVTLVDINADGFLDIYICNAGVGERSSRKNELFINNQDLSFTEKAADFNLDEDGITTHASFFDYDKDGDLDVYLLNNSYIPIGKLSNDNRRKLNAKGWNVDEKLKGGGDKLLRNDDGKFIDVTTEANIFGSLIGFGLGVSVGDVNNDTYLDIYVSNDFYERDYLYINNQNGTFTEEITHQMQHISHFSMGADMADLNNDGFNEIFITDMLSEEDKRLKETTRFEGYDLQQKKIKLGFYHQFMHNTLQLNTGKGFFQEISYHAGVARSEWSWGALLFDMNNDGYRDIYVSNGIYYELINQDFVDFFANEVYNEMERTGKKSKINSILEKIPVNPLVNFVYENSGQLSFTNKAKEWGFDTPSFSNGSAYGDLDNDGDLDLIVNNVNQNAFLYRNNTSQLLNNNFVKIKLEGEKNNTFAVGSTIKLFAENEIIRHDIIASRGFQSSVDYVATLGIGKRNIDSLQVVWFNGKETWNYDVKLNTTLIYSITEARQKKNSEPVSLKTLFSEVKHQLTPHQEDKYNDFDYEGLISEMLSNEGPTIAVGDVNNDNQDDIFIGGAKGFPSKIYLNKGNGKLLNITNLLFEEDKEYEDTASCFFDMDNDGDKDLFVASGGNTKTNHAFMQHRIYINDGKGNYTQRGEKLPLNKDNIAVVAPYDFDQDGDIDLFIGARSVVGIYGINPKHQLLENDGHGHFKDVTEKRGYVLHEIGMITDASWADLNNDKILDLVIISEWDSPKILINNSKKLSLLSTNLENYSGWWTALKVVDINNDNQMDLILGNKGTNIPYKASRKEPLKIYINDFDDNGTIEQIMSRNINGKEVPIPLKLEMINQIVFLRKNNIKYADYATKTIQDLFSEEILQNSIIREVNTSQSLVAINQKNGQFSIKPLPMEVQFSSINAILTMDVNSDSLPDLIVGGNKYAIKPQYGGLDASKGEVLINKNNGHFSALDRDKTGLFVPYEVKNIQIFKDIGKQLFLIIGNNNHSPVIYKRNEQ